MRWRRWLIRIAVGLVAIVVVLLIAGWLLLRSSLVAGNKPK